MGSLAFFDLASYIRDYELRYFVESGTSHGNGVREALKYSFERVYSVEIHSLIAAETMDVFKDEPRVCIINMSSVSAFEMLLPRLDGNILFWLDGHYPGSDHALSGYMDERDDDVRLPLQKELEAICDLRHAHKDVILLDDLWIYRDNGRGREELRPRQKFVPEFWKNILAKTHDCVIFEEHEIYAFLFPKKLK